MNLKPIIILFILIVGITAFWYYSSHPLNPTLTINKTHFILELAVTNAEKERGLSGRAELPVKHGMLFLYDHKERYPYTMKGMSFPLDFVWLDGNRIVDITKSVLPNTPVVLPEVPIDKVFEINAGEADLYDIKLGDTALFNK